MGSRAASDTLKLHFTAAFSLFLLLLFGLFLRRFLHLLRLKAVRFVCSRSLLVSQQILLFVFLVQTLHHLIRTTLISCLQEHAHVHCEFDCVASRSRSEVVLTSFEAVFPGVEMHHGHLVKLRVLLVEVQRL